MGPFPRAIGNRRFAIVAIDYFTKLVEKEALANIRDVDVKKSVWKNIIARFGIPETLISNNGLQFDNKVGLSSMRFSDFSPKINDVCIAEKLDLLE